MPADNIAIRVSHLCKQYKLGGPQEQYHTFRDALINSLKAPFKVYRKGLPVERFWALKDVSFDVEQGEVVGIIGRNGAGKSTLLKILSRITSPTEGSVELHGRVGSLLEVGTGFHPELTGRENIYLSGSILGMKRKEIDAKLDYIVKFSEIEKFLDTPVKRYSSGMYVRLAFSVAAHLEPEILIIDEVLAVGDVAFQKKCLGKMGEVANEGRTVLFVSHNMGAVNQLCDKGIWLDKGQIKMIGDTNDVISTYLSVGDVESGEHKWNNVKDAPGNEKIRLHAVRVLNPHYEVSSVVDMSSPFFIQIIYDILIPCLGMRTGFWLLTYEGVLIFVSGDSVDPLWQNKKRESGRYSSICKIPENFLNSGIYLITVAADIPGIEMLFKEESILKFSVETSKPTLLDGFNRSPGIICPQLQ